MYRFQLLAIDTVGESEIESLNALKHGILSSDKLLKNLNIQESDNRIILQDTQAEVSITISMVDTSQVLNDLIDAAFIVSLEGENSETIEAMRTPLLVHLRKRLLFSNLRILIDDVSANIAQSIYPIINDVELRLRKYLMQFFIQKVGVNWWQLTAPRPFIEKVNSRRFKFKDLSEYVTLDVSLIDFDDLGELIYKHNTGFQRSEALIEKIKQEDGIIIGMANMDEFAGGASGETSAFGVTKNLTRETSTFLSFARLSISSNISGKFFSFHSMIGLAPTLLILNCCLYLLYKEILPFSKDSKCIGLKNSVAVNASSTRPSSQCIVYLGPPWYT
jgi:hypothetical protein